MKRMALVLAFAVGGCAFAQKHPAVAIGIVAGSIGFGTCGIAVEKLGTCTVVGAGAGVVMGGITGLVNLIFVANEEELEEQEDPIQRRRGEGPPPGPYLPPEPNPVPATVLPDAGVADAGVPAPADASSAD